jgi:hypothetical protein
MAAAPFSSAPGSPQDPVVRTCDVHVRLTITPRVLLKRNYNTMNQAFIAIIVKIPAPKFTIPTRFMD